MIAGCVELLSQENIRGWALDTEAPGPAEVELWLNGRLLRKISANRRRPGFERFPCDGRVGFAYRLAPSLMRYIHTDRALSFRVKGVTLPVERRSLDLTPPALRADVDKLFALLDSGHIITKKGHVRLSLRLDTAWQEQAMASYADCRRKFLAVAGYDLTVAYGTLLGVVREHDFISSDDDFDLCYLSRHSDTDRVRREMVDIACALIAQGETLTVGWHKNLFHWKGPSGPTFDLYPSWVQGSKYCVSFSIVSDLADAIGRGFVEQPFKDGSVLIPAEAERVLEAAYGPGWRTPDPLFQWAEPAEVKREMKKIRLSEVELAEIDWQRHYAGARVHTKPSPFAHAALQWLPREIRAVIDLGCGDGRDTCFVAQGRPVLGVDYSSAAVEKARAARPRQRFHQVDFIRGDVRDTERLLADTREFLAAADGPVAIYARFFVHAIDDEAEAAFLAFCQRGLRPRSRLLLEFRTTLDQVLPKTFADRYRRFVEPALLVERMRARGFELVHHQEGRGYARYRDEDPHIARMVFVKSAPAS
jgi:SAM-dependent methyltransferase